MKKTLIILTIMFLLCGTLLYAVDKEKLEREVAINDVSPSFNSNYFVPQNRDLWDILNVFDCSAPSHPGTETDGINIYTAAWNAGTFSRYDMDGALLGDFTVAGASNIRDMAYDGTYFYGSPATTTIYIMDLANETLIGTIPVTCAGVTGVRHIAFDPELDGGNGGFWVGNWAELGAITMSGAQIHASMTNPGDLYGSAYDEWTDGGPYLWLFAQTAGGAILYQFDIAAQAVTGVTHDASDIPGFNAGIAGGLATYVNDDGLFVMLANIQQSPNIVGVYEIAITADPAAPGAPTDVVVTPDAGGALEAFIGWTCPSLQVDGNPLTDLDEMRVYRGEDLIYTDTAPVIGAPGSYTDVSVPLAEQYTYKVVGYNDFDEGIPATVTVWVGEDSPDAVTNLVLTDVSTTILIAQLDWTNPTTGLHGGYFPGVTGYDIERVNDGTIFTVTGSTTTWQDNTVPAPGVYSYTVTPFNNSGSGPSTTSAQVGIGVSIIQVGNADLADYQIPQNLYWHNSIVECVYDMEWLGTDMLINAISFHAANIGSAINDYNFEIWLGEIDLDDLSCGFIDATQLTMVFDGTISVPTGDYWLEIPLDTTFEYTYAHNLVMGTVKDDDQYYSTADTWWTTESGTANRSIHQYSDTTEYSIQSPPTTTLAKTTYADVRFTYSALEHGDVEGVITDNVTSNPVDGVEVYVGNWGPVTTNALGEYLVEDIVTGLQPVTATKDGYYDFFGEVDVIADVVVTYDIGMDPFEYATLSGTVTDVDTNLPIEDAEVYLISDLGYEFWATTNASGDYSIVDIVSDTYDITCTATGYIPMTLQDIVFSVGAAIVQDFALQISIYYFSDFEDNDGYLLSNNPSGWQWGAPTSGPGSAHSGSNVWGTILGGDYPTNSNFTLDTTIPVGVVSTAYMLEFWHWYDIESSYDGGNVKVSTDDGASWAVITPLTGYTGTANTANPLSGEPIFCGHDQGFWELVEFDLSAFVGENILVRWHFGSDSSVQYPGWYIDDVRIYEQAFGALEGYVTDFGLGNPIADAEITIGLYSGISEADGYYFIDGIVTGTYDVTCVSEYFLPAFIGDVVIEASITTTQDIDMLWSEVAVDVTDLTSYLPPDDMEVQTFTITNDGPGDLEYSISLEFPAEVSIRTFEPVHTSVTPRVLVKNGEGSESSMEYSPMETQVTGNLTDEIWDVQGSFRPIDASGVVSQAGMEFDGTYFYCPVWNSADICKYDIDGNHVETFQVPGVSSTRDLAYDGQYMYGGSSSSQIYCWDPATYSLITTINSSQGLYRAIAYDSDNDGFLGNNWDGDIVCTARDGSTIYTIPALAIASLYGMAYDNISAGGPFLWVFAQSGSGAEIHQIDIASGSPTGVMHNVLADFPSAGIAGGLWTSPDYVSGTLTIGGLVQGEDAFMYELCETENWVMVTNNASGTVPGNGGTIEVEVQFDATELLIGEEFTADLLIHNNSNYGRGDDYVIPVTLIISGNIPPVNLAVDEELALFTWDTPPGSDRTDPGNDKNGKISLNNNENLRDLLGYNVFLDDMGTSIGTTTENYWQYDITQLTIGDDYVAGVSAVYDDGESEVQEFPFTYLGTDAGIIIPLVTELRNNFPNPFNPVTQIAFSLKEYSRVQITIYNIRGQLVKTLVDEQREANNYTVTWNGTDDSSKSVSSGVYFYKMVSEGNVGRYTSAKKMILMK